MGDDGSVIPRLSNMKALLGIVAGAGASYGIYKLISGGSFKRNKKSVKESDSGAVRTSSQPSDTALKPGSLLAKVSGLDVVCPRPAHVASGDIIHQSPGNLEPQHLKMLLSCLQTSNNQSERCQILLTLGNAAAFTVNQNLIREFEGIHIIAGYLSDPVAEVRVQTLNALNNLCMNIQNQEQIKVYVSQVLELIEMSPVNSDLQLAALRLLTNLSVTDKHQHLLKESVTLLLSLLVVSSEALQVQALRVLVNLSSNPDIMDDIVQAQAPASVVLLFDTRTAPPVLLRLLTFAGNLKAWRPSDQVAHELRRKQDCLFRVMLDESSQLHSRLVQLLSHPDGEIQAQVARILT
ncbi:armadillo repeat-containing protein 10 [Solea senegalensis]|uniref:Armadillo repeat-containing protein 10 n=1 Tax=Solea senegalensis TaxID=28829 RepID=A0AAV6T0B5_SOLSE|nr:armadillo repeat-containing protein 10 [Solea senegalensis]KAG7522820.1 armadillo repeat-containing protein 10 [Solea senegalensis]